MGTLPNLIVGWLRGNVDVPQMDIFLFARTSHKIWKTKLLQDG